MVKLKGSTEKDPLFFQKQEKNSVPNSISPSIRDTFFDLQHKNNNKKIFSNNYFTKLNTPNNEEASQNKIYQTPSTNIQNNITNL